MARMHSRDKGKSKSTKPFEKKNPAWVSFKPNEVEALVVKFGKDKTSAAQIGLKLRDTYGIPSVKVITKKTISQILTEKKLNKQLPQDLIDLIQKSMNVRKHMEENGQDKTAKRGLQLTESKVLRLIKYYKKSGKISQEWKYNPKQAGNYIE